MTAEDSAALSRHREWLELERKVRGQTPARLMEGRVGSSYRTSTQLQLRTDHAAARDAVQTEMDLSAHLGTEFVEHWGIFEVSTRAATKAEYLLNPELGRMLNDAAHDVLQERCPKRCDLQIVIGDGLSVRAISSQVPALLPLLMQGAEAQGWRVGQVFAIRHCRVGLMNELGEVLDPAVVVMLVGERPGLATAESLSAYMGYRPHPGNTDAQRNLVSNIHAKGLGSREASERILRLVETMLREKRSGVSLNQDASFRGRTLK